MENKIGKEMSTLNNKNMYINRNKIIEANSK